MTNTSVLPTSLHWLADAPLFIDEVQVNRFYDAVVRPANRQGSVAFELTEQNARQLEGMLKLEAGLTTEKLAGLLAPIFAFIKPDARAAVEGRGKSEESTSSTTTIELLPVDNAERKLELLTLHYLFNHPQRLLIVDDPSTEEWRDPEGILEMPRGLVFLDLPSEVSAHKRGMIRPCLIPTAGEFDNGKVIPIYQALKFDDGGDLPDYPDSASSLEQLAIARRAYWNWFATRYSASRAMQAVERAAEANGRIRWMDYRLPVSDNGDTLHLHIVASGQYDTGVFAYNFIKRGYKHGLRIVGTLKSEPDVNVLAVYEK